MYFVVIDFFGKKVLTCGKVRIMIVYKSGTQLMDVLILKLGEIDTPPSPALVDSQHFIAHCQNSTQHKMDYTRTRNIKQKCFFVSLRLPYVSVFYPKLEKNTSCHIKIK